MRKFQRAAVVAAAVAGLSTLGVGVSFANGGDAPQITAVANSQANAVATWGGAPHDQSKAAPYSAPYAAPQAAPYAAAPQAAPQAAPYAAPQESTYAAPQAAPYAAAPDANYGQYSAPDGYR
ncbi:hypothetical protein SSP24_48990 [Streptomyces spinoverrucosus]|uniref:Uncharacterized protein n=1 Tax=Streptomyces spinoverrucosus TaxID=284043 RepID=A0A4Y3VJX0_9ACTN|nr:hypothetical protein [Streptomyces spinoverrucosus]GEC07244.1 hypothetical protein SSP24_48990 [Streptomyces spinoverrucosus]GHB90719.1 hypothetical protein GCM10010397_73660 [Streptomyces spinoverrucosus]